MKPTIQKYQTYYIAKTYPPRKINKVITPEHFNKKLRRVSAKPIVIFNTPPGFGKTTLLTAHRKKLIKERNSVFWLTLTEHEQGINQLIESIFQCIKTETNISQKNCHDFCSAVNKNPKKIFYYLRKLLFKHHTYNNEIVFIFDDIHKIENSDAADFLKDSFELIPENLQIIMSGQIQDIPSFLHSSQTDETVVFEKSDFKFSSSDTKDLLTDSFELVKSIEFYSTCHSQSEGWPLGAQFYFRLLSDEQNFETTFENTSQMQQLNNSKLNPENIKNSIKLNVSSTQIKLIAPALFVNEFDASIIAALSGRKCSDKTLKELAISTNIIEEIPYKYGKYQLTKFGSDILNSNSLKKFSKEALEGVKLVGQKLLDHTHYETAAFLFLSIKDFKNAAFALENCAEDMIEKGSTQQFLGCFENIFDENKTVSKRLLTIAIIAYATSFQKDKLISLREKCHQYLDKSEMLLNKELFDNVENIFNPVSANKTISESLPAASPPRTALEQDLPLHIHSWQLYKSENFEAVRHYHHKKTRYFSRYSIFIEGLSWFEQGFIGKSNQTFSSMNFGSNKDTHLSLYSQVMQNFISCLKQDYSSIHMNLIPKWSLINTSSAPQILMAAYKARTRGLVYEGKKEDALELLEQGIFYAHRRTLLCAEASLVFEKINVLALLKETSYVNQSLKILFEKTNFDITNPLESLNGNHPQNYALLAYLRAQQLEKNDAKIINFFTNFNIDKEIFSSKILSTHLNLYLCHALLRTAELKDAHRRLEPIIMWLSREKLAEWLLYEPHCLQRYVGDHFEPWRQIRDTSKSSKVDYQFTINSTADHYIFENLSTLTPRETEVLEYLVAGHDNKTIGKAIMVSVETIKWHIKNVYQKLGIQRREHLISVLSKTDLNKKSIANTTAIRP